MIPVGPEFHKPKSFIAAKNTIYAALFLAVANILLKDYISGMANSGGIPALAVTAAGCLFVIFLVKQMSFCRKWARTVLLILYLLMPIALLLAFIKGSVFSLLETVLFIFQNLLQLIALVFLFRIECNLWFNQKGAGDSLS